jgi:hypothetical protein
MLAALLALAACNPAGHQPPQVTLAYIGNFRGFQRPCGCNEEQYGGLLRLGTVLQQANVLFSSGQLPAVAGAATPPAQGNPKATSTGQPAAPANPDPAASPAVTSPAPMADPLDAATTPSPEIQPSGADAAGLAEQLPPGFNESSPGGAAADTAPRPVREAVVRPPQSATLPQPLLFFDCGNFAWPQMPFPALRVQSHLQVLQQLGARAAVLGGTEMHLTAEDAVAAFENSPLPLVSCNLRSKDPRIKILPSFELAPGWVLTGLSSWQPAPNQPPADSWWEQDEPLAAAQAVLEALPPHAQVVLVALDQPQAVLDQLQQLPLTVLIGTPLGTPQDNAAPSGKCYPAPPGKGTKLELLSLSATPGTAPQRWEVLLGREWQDDAQVSTVLKAERQRQRELLGLKQSRDPNGWKNVDWGNAEKYLPDKQASAPAARGTTAQPAAAQTYSGPKACLECHREAYAKWAASKHAHAFQTLEEKGEQDTLDCQKCHTVGLLEPGGFDPLNPRREVMNVSCESCHGPCGEHVVQMQLDEHAKDLKVRKGNRDICLTCHDAYNSPKFDRDKYWDEIKHQLDKPR